MSSTRRRLVLLVLLAAGLTGVILVVTAPADGPALESVVTDEGLATEIPLGWQRSEQFAFEFHPPSGNPQGFDRWTVARACGPADCGARSLAEWEVIGRELPTFVEATAADSGLEVVRDESAPDHRVLVTRTPADTTIVFVAAFRDGADFYVECGVSIGVTGDERLADAIVDVCRETEAMVRG